MKKIKNKKLFITFCSLFCSFILVMALPMEAAAYNESYSYSGTRNGYAYTVSGTCNEFAGTAQTTYGTTADLMLHVTGYYIYLDGNGNEINSSRSKTYSSDDTTSISARVTPSTFQSGLGGMSAMCKVTTIHYINSATISRGTAQFQAWG